MVNRRLNGGFGPSRRVRKPSKMKSRSKIMKKCLKEVKITKQYYMKGLQDKGKAQKMPPIPSEKPINVRETWPNNLKQPPSGWLKKSSFSLLEKTESRANSLGLNNGVTALAKSLGLNNGVTALAKNTLKSRAFPRPDNDSSRSNKDPQSSAKKMKKSKASSLGLNNDAISFAKNTKEYWDCCGLNNSSLRHKKIEKSRASSSRLINGAMSSTKYTEMPKVSSSQNNGVMSAMKNAEKSRPCSSSQENGLISFAKYTEKSRSSLLSDRLPVGKLANPTYTGSKDDPSSTLRVLNNSRPLTEVVSGCMPKNVDVKDQCNKLGSMAKVILDNNHGKRIDARKDGTVVSKCSTNKEASTSKDGTMVDKNKYIRVDLSSVERAMGGEVRKKDLCKAMEVTNFSLALKGSQVIENDQHISGNNSSPISKDLSNHQLIMESLKDCINIDSKNQNTSLEDDDITDDNKLKRKRRGGLLVEEPETHEDDGKEAVRRGPAKKRRTFIDNYEEDEGDDQNLAGVRGVAAGVTISTAILKDRCTEGSKSFVSESAKLQYYSLRPIDEPIWSGIFKIGSKEYVSMAAHLSPKSCEKVWEVSRSLRPVVKVTKLSRLEVFPKGSAALKPTHDNIALYFLPHEMRPNEGMDQLVKELIEDNMVLRAVVKEAEMLILPSILLPEQHKSLEKIMPLYWKNTVAQAVVHDEEMGKQDVSHQHVVEEGSKVAGLNIDCEIQAPELVERQHIEKEPSPSLAESNAPNPAEVAARPTSAPTTAAAMSSNHVQSNSSLGVPSGAVFAFVSGETPRLKELIQELKRDGAVVVAMQGEMIG